jgi:hypothetical protein
MVRRITVLALFSFALVSARGATIDFETFPDSTPIVRQHFHNDAVPRSDLYQHHRPERWNRPQ